MIRITFICILATINISLYGQVAMINSIQSHHFGQVNEGDTVVHQFVLTNTGEATLEISAVEANCNCLLAEIESTSIAPATSTNLSLTFYTKKKVGHQKKMVTIISNAVKPKYFVEVEAEVEPSKIELDIPIE